MGLRDIEATLPPGFRFHPRDEELVCHYLCKRVANERLSLATLIEVDLHTCEPWQLPDAAMLGANEWYFFSFRDRKYATGVRANRATNLGYWKATGKDRPVYDPNTQEIVGMRKTLVFYLERAPNGKKTGWVMHEFRLESPHTPPKEDWVLCRVFHKRKKEACTQYRLEEERIGCSSTNMVSASPCIEQNIPYNKQMMSFSSSNVYHQQEGTSPTNKPMLNLAVLHYNFLEFPQDMESSASLLNNNVLNIGRGCNNSGCTGDHDHDHDQYGFLLDSGFEDDKYCSLGGGGGQHGHHHHHHHNHRHVDEMVFHVQNDDIDIDEEKATGMLV